jgi:hypothetical protein
MESPEIQVLREPGATSCWSRRMFGVRNCGEGLIAGAVRVLAIFDKPDQLEGPYFEETVM